MIETLDDLIEKIRSYNTSADLSLVKKAYEFASGVHKGQMRLSGDPFITHPLNVAIILAELEQDPTTIAAALLHDTIEDGGLTREGLAKDFSDEVARLVEGVTKLGQLTYESREERQAENFRKMFLAMAEDIRIIIIKLADRLHNMRTLEFLPKSKQHETSIETRDIFAPLAHRLGVWRLKWELEDLAFRFLEPDKFNGIREKVAETRSGREKYIEDFIEKVKKVLDKSGISYEIKGRAKHFFSIYQKMESQDISFDEIYDLTAVRVIVDSVNECYAVLGVIHDSWKPVPGRFTDYIATPKPNGYQSLHTAVIGPGGRPVEIQIRTKEMNKASEYGIAAHWRYKEGKTDKELDSKMAWFRQMLEWQTELKDAKDFMESLKIDLFADEVFVYTPKGAVFGLPAGSTPVDFAYRVHTEVGHRCMGSKANGRIVPLDYRLRNSDIVEIITTKEDNPKLDWLNFVRTPAARTKVKGWFKKQKRDETIVLGRSALESEIKKLGLIPSDILSEKYVPVLMKEYNFSAADDLYSSIGYGETSAFQVAKRARAVWQKDRGIIEVTEEAVPERISPKKGAPKGKHTVSVSGLKNVLVRFSKCCRPLPGEEIVGFVTKGRGVAIHRRDCPNIANVEVPGARLVKVDWVPGAEAIYPVEVEVQAFDRVGVLKDILEKIVETKTNVSGANVKTKRGSTAFIKLVVDVVDVEHLTRVMKAVREIADVYDVYRTDTHRTARIAGNEKNNKQ